MAGGAACSSPGCEYVTPLEIPDDVNGAAMLQYLQLQLQQLQLHMQGAHPVVAVPQAAPVNQPTQRAKAKMDQPKIQLGVDEQTWNQFMTRWNIFKTAMGVNETQSSMYFFSCLDKDLGDEVLKANPGTPPQDLTETVLVASTKRLAVKVESKLVHRIRI